MEQLRAEDPVLFGFIEKEYERQSQTLAMVASCSIAHPSVLACEGTFTSNVTAEGYPGARFHAGCVYVDEFEQLAIDRAKVVFGATYANVQPHTASTANQIVMASLLKPGETLLGLDLDAGGHLSHGARVNISGQYYNAVSYGITPDGVIDYDRMADLAREHRPKLIICGTTAYPRTIHWDRFREVADEIGAYVLADITHIAGLVIAGVHPNPIDIADITTTCTHKQLYGPRGGLILLGKYKDRPAPNGKTTLAQLMGKGLFPYIQGAPIVNNIVAKARALDRASKPEFQELAKRIVTLAQALAEALMRLGARVISNGTDNHIVVVDVLSTFDCTGIVAEKALEECNLIVNKNRIVGDTKAPTIGSGIRIGTNAVAARKMTSDAMDQCANLIWQILEKVECTGDHAYRLDPQARDHFKNDVQALCRQFPIPGYPGTAAR